MNHGQAAVRRTVPGLALLAVLAATLSGCTGTTGAMSDAFVDPSIYDLYDCNQLAAERTNVEQQLVSNQRLIDKARTGVAGDAVAELAYGNTNLRLQGQRRLIDRMWQKNRCDGSAAPAAPQSPTRQR